MVKTKDRPQTALKDNSDDILHSSVFKLAWPIFIQLLLNMCLGYADTLMLSGYTQTAVAAIGNANQVLGFLTLTFAIISSASGVVVSQYLGAGKKEQIGQIYTVCLSFNLVLSLFISLLIFCGSDYLLGFINTPAEILPDAKSYMRIVGGFIFTQAIMDTFARIFQSNGKTVYGMIISMSMNVLNIGGNYLFLYGPLKSLGLGASGVGVSTTVSRIIGLFAAYLLFHFFIDGDISVRYLKPFPFNLLKTLLKLGVPTAGENISYNISQLFVTSFVNTLGLVAINTRIYANILCNFAFMYSAAVSMGTMIIVGHAVGAGEYDYAYKRLKKTMRGALVVAMCIAGLNFMICPWTFGIFANSSESVEIQTQIISLGQKVMLVAIFLEFGRTCNLVIINSLKAAGDVKFPTILGICSNWGCTVLCGYLLGIVMNLGLVGIWMALAADEILRGIIVLIRWNKGSWRGKSVIIQDEYNGSDTPAEA